MDLQEALLAVDAQRVLPHRLGSPPVGLGDVLAAMRLHRVPRLPASDRSRICTGIQIAQRTGVRSLGLIVVSEKWISTAQLRSGALQSNSFK